MKKKFFAVALATTMALSTVISASAETLTGTKWWDGKEQGVDYTLSGDGSVALNITLKESKADETVGPDAFSVEVWDGNDGWYLTTGSDKNAWWAKDAGTGPDGITGIPSELKSELKVGETYKVTVTRNGSAITVKYENSDGSTYAELKAADAKNVPDTLKIHVMAQVGSYDVTEATAGGSEQNSTTAAPTENGSTTKAPAATTTKAPAAAKTGDVAPVAALAAVAVVACAAVVVSKKKVTE